VVLDIPTRIENPNTDNNDNHNIERATQFSVVRIESTINEVQKWRWDLSHCSDSCWSRVTKMKVTNLYRYAVKGLSGDELSKVHIGSPGETFPDDRRFALLQADRREKFKVGEWLHKENFLCAFSAPELLAKLKSSYSIRIPGSDTDGTTTQGRSQGWPCDVVDSTNDEYQRILTLRERATGEVLLNPLDLQIAHDRQILADFLSKRCNRHVVCVTADDQERQMQNDEKNKGDPIHIHQFGNTSSGNKHRGDTRTIHIVNQATVRHVAETLGMDPSALTASRFRPNIVVDDVDAWSEFAPNDATGGWIGKTLWEPTSGFRCKVLARTVRCQGVSVDPLRPQDEPLDIPALLAQHYPQYGPYLGVYAAIETPGILHLGSRLELLN